MYDKKYIVAKRNLGHSLYCNLQSSWIEELCEIGHTDCYEGHSNAFQVIYFDKFVSEKVYNTMYMLSIGTCTMINAFE